jgi:Predicted hydrolases or acyltransferases (alpha/beta hydrolase superfamily)
MPFAEIRNHVVAYRDTGAQSAPAVLLAHPLGMSQAVWDEVVARLCDRWRLISWDLPGHGASAPVAGAISASDLAADAVALLDHLNIGRAHFVGTSIGGVIGQALLLEAPARLDRVALTNTGAVIGHAATWHERAARVREEGLTAMASELVERWFAPALKRASPATLAGWQLQLAPRPRRKLCATVRTAGRHRFQRPPGRGRHTGRTAGRGTGRRDPAQRAADVSQ